MNTTLN